MPGDGKLSPCPKGEKRDQKTKKCVKKPSPKKRSPKRNTLKKNSPKSANSSKSPGSPLLSKIKPDVSDHDYKYLEEIIGKLLDTKSDRAYTNNSSPKRFMFYKLNNITELLNDEISTIKEKHTSHGYGFRDEKRRMRILKELNKLNEYAKRKADKLGRVKAVDIDRLYS